MKTSDKALAILQRFEGCKLSAYKCPAGVWTIGFGHTGADVVEGLKITMGQAEGLLKQDVVRFEDGVLKATKGITLTQGQFDALVIFTFNIGLQAFSKSTLLKKIRAGELRAAADEFLRWGKAKNKEGELVPLPGLMRRREAERSIFLN